MGESKTSPRRITATQKAAKAVRLRAAGYNYDEIAAAVGYRGGKGSACKAVQRALAATLQEPSDEYRRLQQERIDTARKANWNNMLAGHVEAIRTELALQQEEAKLWGLYQPAETKEERRVQYDFSGLTNEQIEKLGRLMGLGPDTEHMSE